MDNQTPLPPQALEAYHQALQNAVNIDMVHVLGTNDAWKTLLEDMSGDGWDEQSK